MEQRRGRFRETVGLRRSPGSALLHAVLHSPRGCCRLFALSVLCSPSDTCETWCWTGGEPHLWRTCWGKIRVSRSAVRIRCVQQTALIPVSCHKKKILTPKPWSLNDEMQERRQQILWPNHRPSALTHAGSDALDLINVRDFHISGMCDEDSSSFLARGVWL